MNQLLNRFNEILKVINEFELTDNLIIIGSWAYYIYQNYVFKDKILPESLKTLDVDILISRNTKFNKAKKLNMINILEKLDYCWYQKLDSEVDKFQKADFEIEFLTETKSKGLEKKYYFENIGINAKTIKYLNLLSENKIKLSINDFQVSVPPPLNYSLHKLLIAQLLKKILLQISQKKIKILNKE